MHNRRYSFTLALALPASLSPVTHSNSSWKSVQTPLRNPSTSCLRTPLQSHVLGKSTIDPTSSVAVGSWVTFLILLDEWSIVEENQSVSLCENPSLSSESSSFLQNTLFFPSCFSSSPPPLESTERQETYILWFLFHHSLERDLFQSTWKHGMMSVNQLILFLSRHSNFGRVSHNNVVSTII